VCIAEGEGEKGYLTAEERILQIASVYSFVSGYSPSVESVGGISIRARSELGTGSDRILGPATKNTPGRKGRSLQSNHLIDDWNRTKTVFPKLTDMIKVKNGRFLRIALFHYYESGIRNYPLEDRFIDACVGLEALFNEGPQDISYKLAIRAALILRLLGKDFPNFEQIKDLYTKRNMTVHGLKEAYLDYDDVLGARTTLMQCLKALIALSLRDPQPDKEQLLGLIDRALLDEIARNDVASQIRTGKSVLGLVESDLAL